MVDKPISAIEFIAAELSQRLPGIQVVTDFPEDNEGDTSTWYLDIEFKGRTGCVAWRPPAHFRVLCDPIDDFDEPLPPDAIFSDPQLALEATLNILVAEPQKTKPPTKALQHLRDALKASCMGENYDHGYKACQEDDKHGTPGLQATFWCRPDKSAHSCYCCCHPGMQASLLQLLCLVLYEETPQTHDPATPAGILFDVADSIAAAASSMTVAASPEADPATVPHVVQQANQVIREAIERLQKVIAP